MSMTWPTITMMVAMASATPAAGLEDATLSYSLASAEFALANSLLYPTVTHIQQRDNRSPCNWIRRSLRDTTV